MIWLLKKHDKSLLRFETNFKLLFFGFVASFVVRYLSCHVYCLDQENE
jgi:hypothetical protein